MTMLNPCHPGELRGCREENPTGQGLRVGLRAGPDKHGAFGAGTYESVSRPVA